MTVYVRDHIPGCKCTYCLQLRDRVVKGNTTSSALPGQVSSTSSGDVAVTTVRATTLRPKPVRPSSAPLMQNAMRRPGIFRKAVQRLTPDQDKTMGRGASKEKRVSTPLSAISNISDTELPEKGIEQSGDLAPLETKYQSLKAQEATDADNIESSTGKKGASVISILGVQDSQSTTGSPYAVLENATIVDTIEETLLATLTVSILDALIRDAVTSAPNDASSYQGLLIKKLRTVIDEQHKELGLPSLKELYTTTARAHPVPPPWWEEQSPKGSPKRSPNALVVPKQRVNRSHAGPTRGSASITTPKIESAATKRAVAAPTLAVRTARKVPLKNPLPRSQLPQSPKASSIAGKKKDQATRPRVTPAPTAPGVPKFSQTPAEIAAPRPTNRACKTPSPNVRSKHLAMPTKKNAPAGRVRGNSMGSKPWWEND